MRIGALAAVLREAALASIVPVLRIDGQNAHTSGSSSIATSSQQLELPDVDLSQINLGVVADAELPGAVDLTASSMRIFNVGVSATR
jgi:hypothetical protein